MKMWIKRKRAAIIALGLFILCMMTACVSQPLEMADQSDKPALTYWAEMNRNAINVAPRFNDLLFFQEWQRRTGVKLDFIQTPSNSQRMGIQVLLSSGDLPDLMEYSWSSFPGGPEKLIKEGYILRLNDVMQYAPNLLAYLKANPEVDRQIKTAEGSYYVFPFVRGDDMLRTFQGPIIRKDWLLELGLDVPTTIDEWYVVLRAFKEKKGAEAPLTFLGVPNVLFGLEDGAFVGAYGVKKGFYLDGDEVKFGPAEPGYKEFLRTFHQWYKEGLIDLNFAAIDTQTMDSMIVSGKSGAAVWNAGAGIGKWQAILEQKNDQALLAPAPYPVLRAGERPKFGQKSHAFAGTGSVAISGKSKHVKEAVQLLDYGYSPEGHMLFNFGIEGLSYEMVDGYPKYTDIIMNNPDGLTPAEALSVYTRANYFGPFVQDRRYIEQYYHLPQQKEAAMIWADTDNDLYALPISHKTEQQFAEYSSIMLQVEKIVNEMSLKIIIGAESIDAFDAYKAKMEQAGLARAIDIEKASYK
jgi:putative aldouronate transport system substrate-binding protein